MALKLLYSCIVDYGCLRGKLRGLQTHRCVRFENKLTCFNRNFEVSFAGTVESDGELLAMARTQMFSS